MQLYKKKIIDIKKYLKDDLLKIYLQFIIYYASKIFTIEFTLLMQKEEESLIHILYIQLKTLILILFSSFITHSALESISFEVDNIKELLENSDNFLNLLDIRIGERIKKHLHSNCAGALDPNIIGSVYRAVIAMCNDIPFFPSQNH